MAEDTPYLTVTWDEVAPGNRERAQSEQARRERLVDAGAMGQGVMCLVGRSSRCRWDRCIHGRIMDDGTFRPHWKDDPAALSRWEQIVEYLRALWR